MCYVASEYIYIYIYIYICVYGFSVMAFVRFIYDVRVVRTVPIDITSCLLFWGRCKSSKCLEPLLCRNNAIIIIVTVINDFKRPC